MIGDSMLVCALVLSSLYQIAHVMLDLSLLGYLQQVLGYGFPFNCSLAWMFWVDYMASIP